MTFTLEADRGVQSLAYHGPDGVFLPDTCAPLRNAASTGAITFDGYGRDTYPGRTLDQDFGRELKSVGSWKISSEQDWGLDWHRNEGIEIGIVTAGRLQFSCAGEDFDLSRGSVTVTRPWQLHRVGRPNVGASVYTWFIVDVGVRRPNQDWGWPSWMPFSEAERRRLTELLSHNECAVWMANKPLLEQADRLERLLSGERTHVLARIASCISDSLLELADVIEEQNPRLDASLSSAQRVVEMFLSNLHHYVDRPWTVDAMANECGLGKTRFAEYCRQTLNVSPIQYLTELRVEKAKSLLRSETGTILQVAMSAGFGSSQYFASVFRQVTGTTPREFRESARP